VTDELQAAPLLGDGADEVSEQSEDEGTEADEDEVETVVLARNEGVGGAASGALAWWICLGDTDVACIRPRCPTDEPQRNHDRFRTRHVLVAWEVTRG
jgi:hypothetical protein